MEGWNWSVAERGKGMEMVETQVSTFPWRLIPALELGTCAVRSRMLVHIFVVVYFSTIAAVSGIIPVAVIPIPLVVSFCAIAGFSP